MAMSDEEWQSRVRIALKSIVFLDTAVMLLEKIETSDIDVDRINAIHIILAELRQSLVAFSAPTV